MKIASRMLGYIRDSKICEFGVLDSLGLTSRNSLRVTLNRLSRAGEIYNPVKGVYVSKEADPFWVATRLRQGYLSLSTALYLHRLIEDYPFTVFVASYCVKRMKLGEHELCYFKAADYSGVAEDTYRLACVEKTFCDCLRHADFVGYPRIAKALYRADFSAGKIIALSRGENGAFFQRLGYLLSLLPSRNKEKNRLLGHCRKKVRANAYLQGRSRKGTYIPEWRLVDNVGEEVIMSWWRQ